MKRMLPSNLHLFGRVAVYFSSSSLWELWLWRRVSCSHFMAEEERLEKMSILYPREIWANFCQWRRQVWGLAMMTSGAHMRAFSYSAVSLVLSCALLAGCGSTAKTSVPVTPPVTPPTASTYTASAQYAYVSTSVGLID